MKKTLLNRFIGTALVVTLAPLASAWADDDATGSTLYLEATNSIKLYGAAVLSNGARALAPKLDLPEESIVAIDVRLMNQALTTIQNSPERLNFPFVTSATQTETQRNGKGWVCGMRIVDVADEDLRETDRLDGDNFCLSLEDIKKVQAMETNEDAVRESFEQYIQTDSLAYMNMLATEIERVEKQREDYGILSPIAAAAKMGSPIRGCSRGCLLVTSEYGMRVHPVLKKKRLHKGLDLRAKIGTPVVAALDGKVLANRTERDRKTKKMKGYGNYVIVVHKGSNVETVYAHLSAFKNKAGTTVKQGDLIALSGNTGIGTAPHLHFETHAGGKKGFTPTNPRTFIGALLSSVASLFDLFDLNA